MDYTVRGILQARILEWVVYPMPGGPPNPGVEPGSPVLQVDSLLHPVYIAEFGVAFLYSVSLWSSLYCGGSSLCADH